MLTHSQHRNEDVVNSYNLYIDSAKDAGGDLGKGDAFELQLGQDAIEARDGHFLRLTLTDFSMFNNTFDVNINNGQVRLHTNLGTHDLLLTRQNYKSVADIALDFSTTLGTQLAIDSGLVVTASNIRPAAGTSMNATSDRVIRFELDFAAPHGITSFRVQCFAANGDSYALLGGNRIDDASSTDSSFDCEIVSTTKLRLIAFYPGQTSTEQYVYLRCGQQNNGVESAVLSNATGPYLAQTLTSNIFAKIPIGNLTNSYFANADKEYFINLKQHRLSTLTLFLTDSRNRPLGRLAGSASGTAAGSYHTNTGVDRSTLQSTLGNLSFTATIRIDVIHANDPLRLNAPPPPPTEPKLHNRGTLVWQNHGQPKM